ncbi:DUF5337 domain-containing protein [Epibacterium ulvae]|uniref:Uncharacterized protein n=1 Tax=Epibacterium ulvae TaxID=1156985 RepID=A0A1G5QPE6_9RHOB|nr:DUF5337 domain-containing protein [Epibacterium ulvae]SCZ63622.1 hypothetical protein SAMN04488118_10594 [Epibacterium ulvae]
MSSERDQAIAKKGQHIAVVIAVTISVWLVLTLFVGPMVGLPGRYALLFDFAALAGMIYALVNIFQLWRMRQDNQR